MTIAWDEANCSFVVEDDTLNGALNGPLLTKEVDSGISSAVVASITTNEVAGKTEATMAFDTEPSAGDKTIVEGLIAAHTGEQSTRDPIKYKSGAEQNTTESTWQTVWTEELPPIKAGAWQADISLELKAGSSDLTSGAQARVVAQKLGGSVTEQALFSTLLSQYDGKSARVPFEAEESDKWELGIQIQQLGGDTAYIRRMRISVTYDGQNFYTEPPIS